MIRKLVWLVSGIAVMTLLSPVSSAAPASHTLTKQIIDQEQRAAEVYWTRERIALAPSMPLPTDLGPAVPVPEAGSAGDPIGRAGWSPPGEQAWDAQLVAQSTYWRDWLPAEETLEEEPASKAVAGTSGVYTHYNVNNQSPLWQIYPHVWDGKLTFTTSGGGASCSATVVSGNNIVTAAHCVYDSTANVWYSGWVFTPASRNASAPYGSFTATACTILTAYANLTGSYSIATWARHDVAVCTLGTNTAGQSINGAVGWAGRTWNAGNAQQVFNSGYPARNYTDAAVPSAGLYLRACTAETFLYTTETLGSGCYWGRGISGGSWLIQYKPFVVSGYVNSVNSGLFLNQPNLYGARFNSNNIEVLCSVRGC